MRRIFLVLLMLAITRAAWADGTINTLGSGTALTGSELIPMFQTAVPAVNTTPSALATYFDTLTATLTNKTINASNNTLTIPLAGTNYSGWTASGNTTEWATVSGSLTNGDVAQFDSHGNIIDLGSSGVPSLSSANTFTSGNNNVPIVALSGTSVTPNYANGSVFTLTLSGNTTVNCPTNTLSSSAATNEKEFWFKQPASGGPYGVTFATSGCYLFSGLGAQPVLTNTGAFNSVQDGITCRQFGNASATSDCGGANGLSGVETVSSIATSGSFFVSASGSAALSVTGQTAGNVAIAVVEACVNSSCAAATGTPATLALSGTGTCAQLTNAFNTGSFNGVQGQVFLCTGFPSGSFTATATYAAGVAFQNVAWQAYTSPPWLQQVDASLGNTSGKSTAGTSGSISTAAATTENDELVFGWCNSAGTPVVSSPATTVGSDSSTHNNFFEILTPVAAVLTAPFTMSSATYGCAIGAVK